MKTKKRSRLMVIFLSFLVCMSLMPMMAFAEGNSAPVINNAGGIPFAVEGKPYEYTFTATAEGTVTWEKDGYWPNWLELDSSTGKIYGTPTRGFSVAAFIKATCIGSDGVARTDKKSFYFNILKSPEILTEQRHEGSKISISGTNLPDATQNSNYLGADDITFSSKFNFGFPKMTIEGVPDGMSDFNDGTCITVDGTPTNAGTYSIKVTLSTYTDPEHTKLIGTTEKTYTLKVNPEGSTPQEEVTVTFDKNGGSGTMADVTVNKDSNYTLPACTFTAPDGKEFKAWEVGDIEKAVGDSITVNANTTVKAIWKQKLPVTYTVSFNKNGGSGSMAAVTKNAGETYALPECGFTAPTGKEFKAWEVNGDAKAVGDSIAVNANTTAKALWKDKLITNYTVTVTDGTADKATAQEGDTVTITANAAPSGQVFAGWEIVFGKFAIEDMTAATTTLTIGTTNVEIKARYNPAPAEHETYTVMVASPISNGSVSVDNDTELWEGDTITITVAPDMGYELSELIAKDDDENSISITKVSDTEYTFDMPAANVRVNATFKEKTGGTVMPQTSTITINPNGGKWADNTTTAKIFKVQVGNTFTIPEAPKRDGYTFLYWEGSRYNPGEQYLVTALDHTFTAVWQKNEVKPTNNENTSSVNTKKVDKTSPKTGDNGMIYVYALELLMAASVTLILKAGRNNNLK